jgi:hypothetical protein
MAASLRSTTTISLCRSTCIASWIIPKNKNYFFASIGAGKHLIAMLDNQMAALSAGRKIYQIESNRGNRDKTANLRITMHAAANFSFGPNRNMVLMSQFELFAMRLTHTFDPTMPIGLEMRLVRLSEVDIRLRGWL